MSMLDEGNMLKFNSFRLALFGAILTISVSANAQSTAAFYTGSAGTLSNFVNATGWRFTANINMEVTALGYYDHGDPGFRAEHHVGLFAVSNPGVSLVETTLPSGLSGTLIDGSRFLNVSSTFLSAGTDYYLLADNNDSDQYVYDTGVSFAPQVTWLGFTDGQTNDIHSTPNHFGGLPGDLGPNFRFNPVPEPATMAALGAGLLALARRRRKA